MSHLTIELLIGSTLCLFHLGVGLGIGWRMGRCSVPGVPIAWPAPPPPVEPTEAQRLLAAWGELRLGLNELTSGVNETQQVPQKVLAHWRAELANLTSELHQVLDRKLATPTVPDAMDSHGTLTSNQIPTIEEETGNILTNAQIEELLSGVGSGQPESVPTVRHKFAVKQPLAGRLNDGTTNAFSLVQCHDLSVRDIRYFVDDLPTEEVVVIGVGLPKPVKWLAGEIEDFRSAFMYGRVGYLVTARHRACVTSDFQSLLHQTEGEFTPATAVWE